MRTTLTLDDEIARILQETAFQTRRPFKRVVNDTLRAGIAAGAAPSRARPYRLTPAHLGGVRPGFDLDRALRLADSLEDEGLAAKLEARK